MKLVASKYTKSWTLKQVLTGIYRLQDNVYLGDIENKVKGHTILLDLLRPFKGMDEDEIENELNTTYEKIITGIQTKSKTTISEVVDTLVDRLMPFIPFFEGEPLTDDDLVVEGKHNYIDAILGEDDTIRQKKLALAFFEQVKNREDRLKINKKDRLELFNILVDMFGDDVTIDNYDKIPQVHSVLATVTTIGKPEHNLAVLSKDFSEGWEITNEETRNNVTVYTYQKLIRMEQINSRPVVEEIIDGKEKLRILKTLSDKLQLIFSERAVVVWTPPPMLKLLGMKLQRINIEGGDINIKAKIDSEIFVNFAYLLKGINNNEHSHILLPKIGSQNIGMLVTKHKGGYLINPYWQLYLAQSTDNKLLGVLTSLNLSAYFNATELGKVFDKVIDNSSHYFPTALINLIEDTARLNKVIGDLKRVGNDMAGSSAMITQLDEESANKLNGLLSGNSEESNRFINRILSSDKEVGTDRESDKAETKEKRLEELKNKLDSEVANLKDPENIKEAESRYEKNKAKIENETSAPPSVLSGAVSLRPVKKEKFFEDLNEIEGTILHSAILDRDNPTKILEYTRNTNYSRQGDIKLAMKALFSISYAFVEDDLDNKVDELTKTLEEILSQNDSEIKAQRESIKENMKSLRPLLQSIAIQIEENLKTVKDLYKVGINEVLDDMASKPRKYRHISNIIERAKRKDLLE